MGKPPNEKLNGMSNGDISAIEELRRSFKVRRGPSEKQKEQWRLLRSQQEQYSVSAQKPTLPKLKFLEGKDPDGAEEN